MHSWLINLIMYIFESFGIDQHTTIYGTEMGVNGNRLDIMLSAVGNNMKSVSTLSQRLHFDCYQKSKFFYRIDFEAEQCSASNECIALSS